MIFAVAAPYALETVLLTGAFVGYQLSTLEYEDINDFYLGSISVTASAYTSSKGYFNDFVSDIEYNFQKNNFEFNPATLSILTLGLLSSKYSSSNEDEIVISAPSSSLIDTPSFAIPAKDFELNPNSTLMLEYKSIMDEIAKKKAELAFIRMTTERISVEKFYTDKDLILLLESMEAIKNEKAKVAPFQDELNNAILLSRTQDVFLSDLLSNVIRGALPKEDFDDEEEIPANNPDYAPPKHPPLRIPKRELEPEPTPNPRPFIPFPDPFWEPKPNEEPTEEPNEEPTEEPNEEPNGEPTEEPNGEPEPEPKWLENIRPFFDPNPYTIPKKWEALANQIKDLEDKAISLENDVIPKLEEAVKKNKADIEKYKTNIVTALKPKTIYNSPNVTLTAPTKDKLKLIGGLHDDCLEKYQSDYDKAQLDIAKYPNDLTIAEGMSTTVYVSPTYDNYGNMISSGGYVTSSSKVTARNNAINSAINSLNTAKTASNTALDYLIQCSENRKKDIVALLDALLDTCMPCSEIKKILIEAYGDVVTDEFDSICNEHDEARKLRQIVA